MSLTIDHIVILVNDLAAAVTDYAALGFTVLPGGEHTDGATHNALVAFADGTYLELLAFQRPAPQHRWWRHTARGEGLIDFALLPGDIAADIAAAEQRGVNYIGPLAGGRLRPDGQEIRWQTGLPPSPELPFLCADVTPRSLRVPDGPARQHPNGVQGIAQLTIAVFDLSASIARYRALLGQQEELETTMTVDFKLGSSKISLAKMTEATLEGPLALYLHAPDAGNPSKLDTKLSHGVPIELRS